MRRHLVGDKHFLHIAKRITKRQDSRLDRLQSARRVRGMDAPNQELALWMCGQLLFLGLSINNVPGHNPTPCTENRYG